MTDDLFSHFIHNFVQLLASYKNYLSEGLIKLYHVDDYHKTLNYK